MIFKCYAISSICTTNAETVNFMSNNVLKCSLTGGGTFIANFGAF